MQIRFYRRVFLSPVVRLTISNGGLSISFGHRSIGWATFGRRGLRTTLDVPDAPGVYLVDSWQWGKLLGWWRKLWS